MVVITLGQRLTGAEVHPHLRRRVDLSIDVFRETDAPYLIFTGGETNPDVPTSEAEAMRDYAVTRGVPSERVLVESNARDTRENGFFARLLVDELDWGGDTVRVVSSCLHLRRAKYIFERCFGDDYEIDASRCVEPRASIDPEMTFSEEEIRRMSERDREFFGGTTPGDVAELRDLFEYRG
ncbi:YdcF family protein [Halopelagius longus]|uniref:DUF218 domain-containing protein n=1 Tax=Halopelagius longus TaxID=1236180 RepID=A0A1H1B560_9EURY|nr:YdcF family protein [Halopelagius longus]RDI70648.1 YdcF family protein [Halopelagius longus]SDQ47069.1 DUF218 domain-containing protein [Halopelagius longus]